MSENTENTPNAAQGPPNEASKSLEKRQDYENILASYKQKLVELENALKQKDLELLNTKQQVTQLEEQVAEAQKFKSQQAKESEEVATLKLQSEDTLTRAKSMLFEKTKVIKNQELQIDALNQQISSLKDVVAITKDLLEIRNLEIKQLETKIKCMEDRVVAEKERHDLMHKKLETMIRHNGELKREYETQLCLFSALRERYNERELAKGVVEDLKNKGAATSSSTAQNSSASNADSKNEVVAETATGTASSTQVNEEPETKQNVNTEKKE